MEGSGRMVVVGVGLNSQVGTIMSLLGATATTKEAKNKKKDQKAKAATKVTPDSTKQNIKTEDEPKTPTFAPLDETVPLSQSEPGTDQVTTNGQSGTAKPAASAEEEEGNAPSDSKHKCNDTDKDLPSKIIVFFFSLAVLQEKLTTLALYIGYIGKFFSSHD